MKDLNFNLKPLKEENKQIQFPNQEENEIIKNTQPIQKKTKKERQKKGNIET